MTHRTLLLSTLVAALAAPACERDVEEVSVAPKVIDRADQAAERATGDVEQKREQFAEEAAEATRDIVAEQTETSAAVVEARQELHESVVELRREMSEVREGRRDFRVARDQVVEDARARLRELEATAAQFLAEHKRVRINGGDFEQPEDELGQLRLTAESRLDALSAAGPERWQSLSDEALDAVANYARAIDELGEPEGMMRRPLRPYAPVAP